MAISEDGDRPMWFLVILLAQLILVTDSTTDDSVQDSVRWAVSDFSTCSAECSGGVQVRTVQCVRSEKWHGDIKDIEVPVNLCMLPSPPETRPCNTHTCTGQWTKGEWSECSETCGTGTQTREVRCESSLWPKKRVRLSQAQCPGQKPETLRPCHVTDCPEEEVSELHSIISENYTLIQLHKAKKIKVNIGGQVNLFPGQTVIVKCPVKKYSKELVYWGRGYKLIPFMGRVRGTVKGLHIDDANPSTDTGVYTCIAGDLTATVTVGFIDENDPVTKMYKKWIRNSKQQYKKYNVKHQNNGKDNNNMPSTNVGTEEVNQQRDQSQNSSHVLMYVIQDWSQCNATCRSVGYQQRNITCSHVTHKFVKMVADSECQSIGVKTPETVRECKMAETSCAVWRPGPWSQCRPSCGKVGYKHRILTCVLQATGEPAGPLCDLTSQPETAKQCKTRPCPLECTDHSRHCSLAKRLKMCRYHHFKTQCCRSCEESTKWTDFDFPTISV